MLKDYSTVEELMKLFSETRDPESWKKFYKAKLLKFFSDFIGRRKSREIQFDKIGMEEIMDFLDEFDDKPILKVNYFSALSAFYKFTYDTHRTPDVMKNIPRPPLPVKKTLNYINEEDIILIDSFIKDKNNNITDRMLLAFFLYTGLSRIYIYNLLNSQISDDKDGIYHLYIEVVGENVKLPLKDILQNIIKEYKKQDGAEIPYNKIFGYNETYITSKVKNLSKKITNSAHTPQMYGNTFIKLALSVSDDVYSISKLTLKSFNVIEKHIISSEGYLEKQQTILNNI